MVRADVRSMETRLVIIGELGTNLRQITTT